MKWPWNPEIHGLVKNLAHDMLKDVHWGNAVHIGGLLVFLYKGKYRAISEVEICVTKTKMNILYDWPSLLVKKPFCIYNLVLPLLGSRVVRVVKL